jgi:predicted nucleic acid-binding protein
VPLLDNSAWSRLLSGSIPQERAEMVVEQMKRRQLATCLPFLLEAGFSARSPAERNTLMERLRRLPHVAVDEEVERLAMDAQRALTDVGHHRLPLTDLVIAACAHRAGTGVLHYDRDYDLIAEHTGLVFESLWVAEAGTL